MYTSPHVTRSRVTPPAVSAPREPGVVARKNRSGNATRFQDGAEGAYHAKPSCGISGRSVFATGLSPADRQTDRQTELKSLPLVLRAEMTERATCWSITINNPTEEDLTPSFPAGWVMKGQIEVGDETETRHYQGMLTTPQVRFSAVRKVLPRAHVEIARNRKALEQYVQKEDTRLETVPPIQSNIPTLFDYQHTIAGRWDQEEWLQFANDRMDGDKKITIDDLALEYVDRMVAQDIESGVCGVEYIAINPMWRSAWKKFWRSMVARERNKKSEAQEE